jgi:hypothetical protein
MEYPVARARARHWRLPAQHVTRASAVSFKFYSPVLGERMVNKSLILTTMRQYAADVSVVCPQRLRVCYSARLARTLLLCPTALGPDQAPVLNRSTGKDHPVLLLPLCIRFLCWGSCSTSASRFCHSATQARHDAWTPWLGSPAEDCCLIAVQATICVDRPVEHEFSVRQNANCHIWVAGRAKIRACPSQNYE